MWVRSPRRATPKRSIGSSELEFQVVLSHQMCAGNSTLVLEESKCSWWLSRLSLLSSLLRPMSLGVEIQNFVHFLPLNATLHHLLVSSLSAEKSDQILVFALFDDCVLLSSGFSLAFCTLLAWVCVLQWPSVFFTPTVGSVSSGHFLASSFSPLCSWDSGDPYTRPLCVCLCLLNTSAFLSRPTWVLSTDLLSSSWILLSAVSDLLSSLPIDFTFLSLWFSFIAHPLIIFPRCQFSGEFLLICMC